MHTISEQEWIDILDDIQDQRALLLIGPEMLLSAEKSLNQQMHQELRNLYRADIAYYYERDGFFLFHSPEGKVRVARQVKRFYRDVVPDKDILQRIVQIPFHLIVSLNPDTFLSDTFYQYGVKHRFHFFQHRHRGNENDEIQTPSSALPLVYNLFGCKDQDDSLVLDYDDVYKMLQSALGTSSLPNKLLRAFKEARTYIFLGFQFDKWYSQLLLKFLSDNSQIEKRISLDSPLRDSDTNGFVVNQFKVQFLDDQHKFFNELHERCTKVKLVRVIEDADATSEIIEVRKRVAMADIDMALSILAHLANGQDWENEVIHTQGRYSALEKDKERIDSRDYRTTKNQILDAILELSKKIRR